MLLIAVPIFRLEMLKAGESPGAAATATPPHLTLSDDPWGGSIALRAHAKITLHFSGCNSVIPFRESVMFVDLNL